MVLAEALSTSAHSPRRSLGPWKASPRGGMGEEHPALLADRHCGDRQTAQNIRAHKANLLPEFGTVLNSRRKQVPEGKRRGLWPKKSRSLEEKRYELAKLRPIKRSLGTAFSREAALYGNASRESVQNGRPDKDGNGGPQLDGPWVLARYCLPLQQGVRVLGPGIPGARSSLVLAGYAFAGVADPIGSGFVAGLRRPGGNLTGLLQYEEGIIGKWLTMLKEIAPNLTRTALVANPRTAAFNYFLQSAKTVASSLAIDLVPTPVDNAADIERAIKTFAREPDGGLVLPPDTSTVVHRNLIIALAAQHRLPAVYALRVFVAAGGLMYYGTDFVDLCRQAGSYVDRILRGANPAELPVQTPTRFETVVNLKTAKALGLTVPPGLLVAADEVIE